MAWIVALCMVVSLDNTRGQDWWVQIYYQTNEGDNITSLLPVNPDQV